MTTCFRSLTSMARAFFGIAHGSRAFGGPIQASISLTNRCNIRCVHCYFYSPYIEKPTLRVLRRARQENKDTPSLETLKQLQRAHADPDRVRCVVEELLTIGTRRFQFSGNGEVFMHDSIFPLIERLKRAGAYCLANTNGTLLDRGRIDELLLLGMDELRITLMGGSRDSYVACHPGIRQDMFHQLTENLLYLGERKAALGVRQPRVVVILVVVRHNAARLMEFAEFGARVGVDAVWYRPFDDIDDPGLAANVLTDTEEIEVRRQIEEAKSYLEARRLQHNVADFLSAFSRQLDTTRLYRVIPCYYGWLSTLIEVDGLVYPCCRCYEPMGNAFDEGFRAVWNSPRYHEFRQLGLSLHRRGAPVWRCDCYSCVHYVANAKVYRIIHPVAARYGSFAHIGRTIPGKED